jgi:hypothetical protein
MSLRRDFYSQKHLYIPRDLLSRGVVPENYHVFATNERISVCLYYELDNTDQIVRKYMIKKFQLHLIVFIFIFLILTV